MTGIKQSIPEGKEASEQALAEAIANMDAVAADSVAGRIDAAISSRSSHQWDPDGVIPATGTLARQADLSSAGGTDWTKTPKMGSLSVKVGGGSDTLNVSGSGYLIGVVAAGSNPHDSMQVEIDGTSLRSATVENWGGTNTTNTVSFSVSALHRFESSLTVTLSTDPNFYPAMATVSYVLD